MFERYICVRVYDVNIPRPSEEVVNVDSDWQRCWNSTAEQQCSLHGRFGLSAILRRDIDLLYRSG